MKKRYTPKEFVDALERAKRAARGESLGKAALAGGFVLETHAKINVRNTFEVISGNLANTIQTTLVSATDSRAEVEVGPTAIYGRIQELGGTVEPVKASKLHWVDENGRHRSAYSVTLPARPYMRPAAEEHFAEIINAAAVTLGRLVEDAL